MTSFSLRAGYVQDEIPYAFTLLLRMLNSKDTKVAQLATMSMAVVLSKRARSLGMLSMGPRGPGTEKIGIGERFWELAKPGRSVWQTEYVRGMRFCRLRWAKRDREWMRNIREASSVGLQNAWSEVIRRVGYASKKDMNALLGLILHILGSQNTFTKITKLAALERLLEIASDIEVDEFNEQLLGLPLPQRPKLRTTF